MGLTKTIAHFVSASQDVVEDCRRLTDVEFHSRHPVEAVMHGTGARAFALDGLLRASDVTTLNVVTLAFPNVKTLLVFSVIVEPAHQGRGGSTTWRFPLDHFACREVHGQSHGRFTAMCHHLQVSPDRLRALIRRPPR